MTKLLPTSRWVWTVTIRLSLFRETTALVRSITFSGRFCESDLRSGE